MNQPVYNSVSLNGVAATLADALAVERPAQAAPPIAPILTMLEQACGRTSVDRVLIHNPDAIGMWLYQRYTLAFAPVLKHTQLAMPLKSVMPSVTPVCFGSMYTGAEPHVHGIQSYTKPVITIDTLFDAVLRAGKKAAIVGYGDCSMGMIYRQRDMDYHIVETAEQVAEEALALIEADRHDLLVVYHGDYDHSVHASGPEAAESLKVLGFEIDSFDRMATAVKRHWQAHDTLLGFATDHGNHLAAPGQGTHGSDMPEDLNVMHFYGVVPKSARRGVRCASAVRRAREKR